MDSAHRQANGGRPRSGYGGSNGGGEEEREMWWQDWLWGLWNGMTAWVVLIMHVFGLWEQFPVFNLQRAGGWYEFGFLVGAGSPFLGAGSGSSRTRKRRAR